MADKATFMEVCGTHTVAVSKSGLRSLLPDRIRLLSGPGCPVCVTPVEKIDMVISIAKQKDVILTSFGDMIRVPGSCGSLSEARQDGSDVRIVYSPVDALRIARENPLKEVVFMGIGFETTSPTVASTVIMAEEERVKNFSIIAAFKLIPPALRAIVSSGEVKVDGFILPGHVSTILGLKPYEFLSRDFGMPGVITGFEPSDILEAISILLKQVREKKSAIEIQYKRAVKPEGNREAKKLLSLVFDITDSKWRGLGVIRKSGYRLADRFKRFDAADRFKVEVKTAKEPEGCLCGEILCGIKSPEDCPLFGKTCKPEHPVGPCMVSSEGSCAAYYHG